MGKKIIALFMIIIVVTFASCNDKTDSSESAAETTSTTTTEQTSSSAEPTTIESTVSPAVKVPETFKLSFSSNDSLNPFASQSHLNQSIAPLIYDSLFTLNGNYQAEPLIAASISTQGENSLVTIKQNIVFSDNTPLTAQDVVYSFELALSSPAFSKRLAYVESAKAVDEYSINFKINSMCITPENLLDFSIVKIDTAGQGKNIDSALIPTGSGRYSISKTESLAVLTLNNNLTRQQSPSITSINLVDLSNGSSLLHNLEIGKLNYVFSDLSSGSAARINGISAPIDINNLVYIGVNSRKDVILRSKLMRQAISYAVNREEIVKTAFQTYATPTSFPFNPSYHMMAAELSNEIKHSETEAKNKLLDAKIIKEDSSDRIAVKYNLLVPEGNEFKKKAAEQIAENLNAVGIEIQPEYTSYTEYISRIESQDFDLYLGEVKLTNNMSLDPFFVRSNQASYGINSSSSAMGSYYDYLDGSKSLNQFLADFHDDFPFIPICFRKGLIAYSRNLSLDFNAVGSNIFYDIENWNFTQ